MTDTTHDAAGQLYEQAITIRQGVRDYFKHHSSSRAYMARDLTRDLTWHPLFTAARELFMFLIDQADRTERQVFKK